MGAVQVWKGTVGKAEQQPCRKLEQLDREVEVVVHPLARDWTYQKLEQKWDKRKAELEKWENKVGVRIERKLKRAYEEVNFIIDVHVCNSIRGEYAVQLNSCWAKM